MGPANPASRCCEGCQTYDYHRAPRLAKHLGVDLFLASETFQYTGSFKFRAAYSVASRVEQDLLITASSGNFGQALAYACSLLGKSCMVVMPATSAKVKVEAVQEYGGTSSSWTLGRRAEPKGLRNSRGTRGSLRGQRVRRPARHSGEQHSRQGTRSRGRLSELPYRKYSSARSLCIVRSLAFFGSCCSSALCVMFAIAARRVRRLRRAFKLK